MNSNVNFKKYNDLSCFDAVISDIGKLSNRNIELCFLDEFGFLYRNEGPLLLTTEIWHRYTYHIDSLQDFCGIQVSYINSSPDKDKLISIVQKELELNHFVAD